MTATADILVVDDEPVVRRAAERVLSEEGLVVASVPDVRGALAHPAADTCRVVVCDLKLPDGSGLDVLRSLRRRRPELPFVMTTGYATTESLAAIVGAGDASFLPKPFDAAELVAAVSFALGLRHTSQEDRS